MSVQVFVGTDTWDLTDEIPYVTSILCFVFCTIHSKQRANMATRKGIVSYSRIGRIRMTDRRRKHFQERETEWISWRIMRTRGNALASDMEFVWFGALVYAES